MSFLDGKNEIARWTPLAWNSTTAWGGSVFSSRLHVMSFDLSSWKRQEKVIGFLQRWSHNAFYSMFIYSGLLIWQQKHGNEMKTNKMKQIIFDAPADWHPSIQRNQNDIDWLNTWEHNVGVDFTPNNAGQGQNMNIKQISHHTTHHHQHISDGSKILQELKKHKSTSLNIKSTTMVCCKVSPLYIRISPD